jgi:ketosteroid isomerase-like protein
MLGRWTIRQRPAHHAPYGSDARQTSSRQPALPQFPLVERLTDLGSGAVLAAASETGRGKGSGAPVDRSFAALYTVIDGKIARITMFRTEQDALEAAGLRE